MLHIVPCYVFDDFRYIQRSRYRSIGWHRGTISYRIQPIIKTLLISKYTPSENKKNKHPAKSHFSVSLWGICAKQTEPSLTQLPKYRLNWEFRLLKNQINKQILYNKISIDKIIYYRHHLRKVFDLWIAFEARSGKLIQQTRTNELLQNTLSEAWLIFSPFIKCMLKKYRRIKYFHSVSK